VTGIETVPGLTQVTTPPEVERISPLAPGVIENTPVVLLYPSGPLAESEVRFIFELNVFQSIAESAPVLVEEASARERIWPERESPFALPRVTASCAAPWRAEIWPMSVDTAPERVARDHDMVEIVMVLVAVCQERVAREVFVVARAPERASISMRIDETDHERVTRAQESVAMLALLTPTAPESVVTTHESEASDEFVVASMPESEAISLAWLTTIPESVDTAPERVFIWFWRIEILPESAFWARRSVK
jgi:hypothetical protein